MRVLITGADGFVGGHLIRHLLDHDPNTEIVGTAHHGAIDALLPEARVKYVPCDIVSNGGADIGALIRDTKPERLYHFAAKSSGAAKERESVLHINVDGTRYVLEAARDLVAPGRILVASTGYVYGVCDHPAREDDPLPNAADLVPYAESKLVMETVVGELGGAIVTRAFNHTGPRQTSAFAVPAFAEQVAAVERGKQSDIKTGNLDVYRDFLDVRDVVNAYRMLLEIGDDGGTYNVSSGVPRLMADILAELCSLSTTEVRTSIDPARARPSDNPFSVGDPSRLKAATGWEPVIPFSQTLADTLSWWRAQD